MSVAGSISGALKRFGRPMTLRRLALGPGGEQVPLDVIVYGTPRGYAPVELVGGISENDTEVTISNTEIAEAQWPGPPRAGDRFLIDGRTGIVQAVESKYLGLDILVFVCRVRMA